MSKEERKSLDKDIQKDETIPCQDKECSGQLKLVRYKFLGCSAKFYRCDKNFRHIFVEVRDKYCSRPVYVEFSL